MKVTSVRLFNDYTPDPLILSFRDPRNLNPYKAKNILGLDPDEIIRKFNGTGGSGAKFYEFSLKQRQLVFQLGLNPQWSDEQSYSDLRDDLYRLISASRSGYITVGFYYGETQMAYINGYVTKQEAGLFERNPEVTVTMQCPYPMLRAPDRVNIPTAGLDVNWTEVEDYLSTAPHGLRMKATYIAASPQFVMTAPDGWIFKLVPVGIGGFQVGDVVNVISEIGAKDVFMMRGTTKYPLADSIASGSMWPLIYPGPNVIQMYPQVQWTELSYLLTYWGV